MKHSILLVSAALAALLIQSCAETTEFGPNDANKRYLDSWIKTNHPEARKDGLGLFILEETQGIGRAIGNAEEYPYAFVTYTKKDLDGNILETTDAITAQQVGTYSKGNHYGPTTLLRRQGVISAGLEEMLSGMNIGGSRTAVIPGWFDTKEKRYSSEDSYLKNVTGTDYIYSLTLHDSYKDLAVIQIDSIENYIRKNLKASPDSVMYGYYYIQTKAPVDTAAIDPTSTVYVNYTGRLLDDHVFDTTDDRTAKDAGVYKSGRTYEPYGVALKEDYTEMSTVRGFSYCVSKMKKGEKGICIFFSDLGYGSSGQSSIPAFSPLRFDIEMLGTEK